jgi:hypothetical protein
MTDDPERLALHLKARPGRAISIYDLATELGEPEERVARDIDRLLEREGFFDLGNDRVMFSPEADRPAFEIFRTAAPRITYEEFVRFRDQPHILMRLSRDREVAGPANLERELHDLREHKRQSRGNRVF